MRECQGDFLQGEFHLMCFSCQANELDSGADFFSHPLVELIVHVVANCKQLAHAVDQCADDDGLFWNFEADAECILHGSNLLWDASQCKDYF